MTQIEIPDRIKLDIDNFAIYGRIPCGFVSAVLTNDLTGAIGRADNKSLKAIHEIVRYVYYKVPARYWGSKEKFQAHLKLNRNNR